MFRIIITGSRDWDDEYTVRSMLKIGEGIFNVNGDDVIVVCGGAVGADTLAAQAAKDYGFKTEVHWANWTKYGKKAGPIRNQEMVDAGADLCLAFIKNQSRGATDCANRAAKAGIRVIRYHDTHILKKVDNTNIW